MEAAKRFFKGRKNGGELGLGELWMSGAFAGTVNTVVANPVEHIRISMFLPLHLFIPHSPIR
jgi:solute carrier family 25 carnitine/acylcarnitine transporter 20/29